MEQHPLAPPPPARKNNPWVIIAMILGGCAAFALVGIAVLAAILFPAMSKAREAARSASCLSNVKQLAVGLQMYVQDYDETYPPAEGWQTGLMPYTKNEELFICPSRLPVSPGYAYNDWLSRRSLAKIENPSAIPAIFESSLAQRNGNDRLQSFATPHERSGRKVGVVGMADGTTQRLPTAPAPDASVPMPSEVD